MKSVGKSIPFSKWFSAALTVASLIVSIILSAGILPLIDANNYPRFIAFILSFIVLNFLVIQINYLIRSVEIERRFDRVTEAIQQGKGMYTVGNIDSVLAYLDEHLPTAKRVENTRVSTISVDNPSTNYEFRHGKAIVAQIAEFANSGRHWTEIISTQGAQRSNTIAGKLNASARYDAYKLRHDFPIMNFIILYYEKEKPEVLFGFGMHQYQDSESIYGSNDPMMVEYFHNYFRTLRDHYSDQYLPPR